jgi:hypothetical protein
VVSKIRIEVGQNRRSGDWAQRSIVNNTPHADISGHLNEERQPRYSRDAGFLSAKEIRGMG